MLSWFSVASGCRQIAWICASAEAAASVVHNGNQVILPDDLPGNFSAAFVSACVRTAP